MTTICPNCKDPACRESTTRQAVLLAQDAGTPRDLSFVVVRLAKCQHANAQAQCIVRAANPKTDLSARLDRIEAMLREKGWML